MDNKGYTLIELISVIALLSIVLILGVYSVTNFLIDSKDKSFNILVNSFEDGVLEAYTSCLSNPTIASFCTNHDMPSNGNSDTIYLRELINEEFVEKFKNPWNTSEECDVNTSYVRVTRNNANSISFTYKTCLKCGNHQSKGCN